eukprot:TRINITY_DN1033_c0_g1_i1.p4 TRINITY_DN1033_c0_g1~~TRINITY_DN1033_c0_g1_i1.p4  ORF type:complete len:106 (-),score=16.70 TRINITY_DN1033_c0_g1_i1:522-839(-)
MLHAFCSTSSPRKTHGGKKKKPIRSVNAGTSARYLATKPNSPLSASMRSAVRSSDPEVMRTSLENPQLTGLSNSSLQAPATHVMSVVVLVMSGCTKLGNGNRDAN